MLNERSRKPSPLVCTWPPRAQRSEKKPPLSEPVVTSLKTKRVAASTASAANAQVTASRMMRLRQARNAASDRRRRIEIASATRPTTIVSVSDDTGIIVAQNAWQDRRSGRESATMAADTTPTSDANAAALRRLKTANTILALVVLVLLGQAAWQAMQHQRAQGAARAGRARSRDPRGTHGRGKAEGAPRGHWWRPSSGSMTSIARLRGCSAPTACGAPTSTSPTPKPSASGCSTSICSPASAAPRMPKRAKPIEDAIRGSDEWKQKHPKG